MRTSVDADPSDCLAACREELQVNFIAAADLWYEALMQFRENGGGRIVNMASRAGQRGYAL
ncbi:hypothetical protein [Rhizobium sp. MHM7A]|uniref:hypothetical protein n=1 Tax=Rhizobium sp. MHM7A TaxID=2583233 RepID=UPI0032B2E7DE